jgi:ATP-dependent DNA helicase RecQ
LQFPPVVYEERKNDFTERVKKMLHYLADEDTCRSKMLLEYFGEKTEQDCGQCDVCRRRQHQDTVGQVAQKMMEVLSDGQPHLLKEMESGKWPLKTISQALRRLMDEELVSFDGDTLMQCHSPKRSEREEKG